MNDNLTSEQSQKVLISAGQRRINIIWEITQTLIAIIVTIAMIYCAINNIKLPELTNSFFLIVGFYFSRTNHTRIGGVKENQISR